MQILLRGFAATAFAVAMAVRISSAQTGDVSITAAWTRVVGATSLTAAGYMTLTNRGTAPDRLVGAETPAARTVEIHEQRMDDGVMRMRPLFDGIVLLPGATVTLRPGGIHLMLVGPTQAFARGERIPLTMRFEHAGEVRVELSVEAAGATHPAHGGH